MTCFAEEIKTIQIGDKIPSVVLKTMNGSSFDLLKETERKPSIFIFYRGGWCPFCNTHLRELQEIKPNLEKMGYQILAISPDKHQQLNKSIQKNKLNYTLLSDSKLEATKAFGLLASSKKGKRELPIPAVLISNSKGVVKFVHFDPKYRKRLSKEKVLSAAKAAISK